MGAIPYLYNECNLDFIRGYLAANQAPLDQEMLNLNILEYIGSTMYVETGNLICS